MFQSIIDKSETIQHLYEKVSTFSTTTTTNYKSDITTGKRYLIILFISNLMETV